MLAKIKQNLNKSPNENYFLGPTAKRTPPTHNLALRKKHKTQNTNSKQKKALQQNHTKSLYIGTRQGQRTIIFVKSS